MRVRALVTGPFQENCYLVSADGGREAVVVDPGDEADRIAAALDELRLAPVLILNTHGHLDHVGAVQELRERFRIPFAIHPLDRFLLHDLDEQAALFGLSGYRDPEVDRELRPGETVEAAGVSFEVLFTPGHTPGHVSFRTGGAVFSGDCLFQGSIGRTDLPGGDAPTLKRTLREALLALPDDTKVFPGHGPATTIGEERRTNPFLAGGMAW